MTKDLSLAGGGGSERIGRSGSIGRTVVLSGTIENEHSFCQPLPSVDQAHSLSRATVLRRSSMPRVSHEHEQAVRDRIVRAALQVFAERGFHRATMQDIVRQSGLSVGAIYTNFKSKSDL